MPSAPTAIRRATSFEQTIAVETPEQVTFTYTIAGVGSRAAAAIIDYAICVLALVLITVAFSWIAGSRRVPSLTDGWVLAVLALFQFALLWGYYVTFETLWDGQTPGKRRLGIRVVQDGGYSISFAASAVRNVTRIIDMQPGFVYAVGIISAAVSKSGKRLGDIVAGTFVVQERVRELGAPIKSAAAAGLAAPGPSFAALTDQEYELLGRFLERQAALEPEKRALLGVQLVARFEGRLPHDGVGVARLSRLFDSERDARARGVAAKGSVGAAREQHLIVARNASRWGDFAALLAVAQRRGLRKMSESEVSDFVARYREVATDLARLQTATRGADTDALFYVSRLVGAGHNLLYRQRRVPISSVWRYMTVTVPAEMRRSALPILAAALSFFGPAAAAYVAVVRDPSLAYDLISPGMIDRAEQAVEGAKSGAGYLTFSEFERPVLASRIIANNVQVTYAVFAFGLTAGILTLLMLVLNGVALGAPLALFQNKGVGWVLLEWIAPHGVLELSAICIAGGGGLLLAQAMLLPGARTRREALVVNGRRAIRLIAGSTFFLLIAGAIEGLISPKRDWPFEWKIAVSVVTALFIALYVTRGRGLTPDAEEENAYS
ncbi:MAG: stage II sporulation protein M [Gemmatimonadaceae bacterium]